jgi:transcriptional regulator with PAS, ATPase and Fis domain
MRRPIDLISVLKDSAQCSLSPDQWAVRTKERESSTTIEIPNTPRSHSWILELQDDAGGRHFPIGAARLTVGSSPRADVILDDPTVSARHCAVTVLGSGIAIEDLGSKNGTFVGNARVKEAWAGLGTTITLGRSTLICSEASHDLNDTLAAELPLEKIAGASFPMRKLAAQVRRLARYSAPVLIRGETGTGKELIARALHAEGPRAAQPFVVINVAALPRELVESELFGHERGSFTGAVTRRAGAFAEAEGGTLFLDEIGELPLDAQPKLLRALDGYEVRRIGGSGSGARANVRVVAATHVPLEERVAAGNFRRDLFHRLEVFVVEAPALRDRRGDIAPIARRLLAGARDEIGNRSLSSSALARLADHDWPGNVRELRNVLIRAADVAEANETIEGADVDRAIRVRKERGPLALTPALAKTIWTQHGENMSAAARAANVPRTTFRKVLLGG